MRAVLQRVSYGKVTVEGEEVASIGKGLVILLGVGPEDDPKKAAALADKCARLRVFEDDAGKMNLSLLDVGGEAIVVSQFTLYADTSRGRRPSFIGAAKPGLAEPLVEVFAFALCEMGIAAKQGVFGAHMMVELCNDGPVTILLEA
ncbi:MAG: D-tyrosyl-tRNA(Tyr) deacylase [Chloroflexi bacterium]|jgi:D-tyrosyl-tRNA(Tyr) deacylase|nr:D-tyrosyl-tRNA(Tyr) deacylase [Chloroflexota bacterium]